MTFSEYIEDKTFQPFFRMKTSGNGIPIQQAENTIPLYRHVPVFQSNEEGQSFRWTSASSESDRDNASTDHEESLMSNLLESDSHGNIGTTRVSRTPMSPSLRRLVGGRTK